MLAAVAHHYSPRAPLIALGSSDAVLSGHCLMLSASMRAPCLGSKVRERGTTNLAITETHKHNAAAMPMQSACGPCALGKLCHAHGVPTTFQFLFPLVDEQRIRLGAGEFLFHAGDQQVGIYAVKAGFL